MGQVFIEKGVNDSVMVVVGQEGRGPCDVNPDHQLCSTIPQNKTEADLCYEMWNSVGSGDSGTAYEGGASGGGASTMWPQDFNGRYTTDTPPFLFAGGGGGTSIQLLLENMTTSSYLSYVSARSDSPLPVSGYVGYTPANEDPTQPVAGGGGGLLPQPGIAQYVGSGNAFATPSNFASGGKDCAVSFNLPFSEPHAELYFQQMYGGFGGGGGACREGGGGGGFEGGSVSGVGPNVSGEGGLSAVLTQTGVVTFDLK